MAISTLSETLPYVKKWLIAFGLSCVIMPTQTWACTCLYRTVEEFLDNGEVDAIFIGEVESVQDTGIQKTPPYNQRFKRYTLAIKEVWKGELGQKTQVLTHIQGTACGYDFSKSNEHLIFAHKYGRQDYADGSSVEAPFITSKCVKCDPVSGQ